MRGAGAGITAVAGGVITYTYRPYCGLPPSPANLLGRLNLDPWLLSALGASLVIYLLATRLTKPSRRLCFVAGWSVAAAALVSPLCALSVSLFSARVGQHMVLATIAAPLIALGAPDNVRRQISRGPTTLAGGVVAFAAALWIWHAPAAYDATFTSDIAYWAMHLSVIGAACCLWAAVFAAGPDQLAPVLTALVLTSVQMAFLGAVITFLPTPVFVVHATTTAAWGLSQLADQQLGGVIMWAPAGVIFVAAILWSVAEAMRGSDRPIDGIAI